jgi:ubiquinone/menaquinone biosynthesis C-methylase UbiE
MSIVRTIFTRAFGQPRGLLGRLGGVIMARMNADCGAWVADLLEVRPGDAVLEVGYGPGVIIQRLAQLSSSGLVAGIDQSQEMFQQASARNATEIQGKRVDLKCGSVESLPFNNNSFDKVIAINSIQVWPDAIRGLREVRRVMKPGGRIALGFTAYSGQPNKGLAEVLTEAGFSEAHVVESDRRFCALATKPSETQDGGLP